MTQRTTSRQNHRRRTQRGNAIIEVALMAPWIFFLFVGVIDVGFYHYAAISAENAARIGAMYTSSAYGALADSTGACTVVLQEVSSVPFPGGKPTTCGALPLKVTATSIASLDGTGSPASEVSVSIKTLPMIPIPGVLANQFTITRKAQMRLRE